MINKQSLDYIFSNVLMINQKVFDFSDNLLTFFVNSLKFFIDRNKYLNVKIDRLY